MKLQLGALRDALLDAGGSVELANRAAEEWAAYRMRFSASDKAAAVFPSQVVQGFAETDTRFARIDARFAQIDRNFDVLIGRLATLEWMLWVVLTGMGAILACICGILGRLFVPH